MSSSKTQPVRTASRSRHVCSPSASSLVSVVIPCYNQARYLAQAIESVLRQTHKNVEIIVVDDGSVDKSHEVAIQFPQVRCIRQSNQGPSAARNAGIRASLGEFVVFLDGDDCLLSSAIESGLQCFERNTNAGFVWGSFRRIDTNGRPLPLPRNSPVTGDYYFQLLFGNYIGMLATVLFTRFGLEVAGGFDPTLRGCEDYDLYLRVSRQFPVAAHEVVIAEYRYHDCNSSRDSVLMVESALRVLAAQEEFASGDRRFSSAIRKGSSGWMRYYCGIAVDSFLSGSKGFASWRTEIPQLATFARRTPLTFLSHIVRKPFMKKKQLIKACLPAPIRRALGRFRRMSPPIGRVDFGDFRSVVPVSRCFGYDRGIPIDRHYIESFLERQSEDVRGRVIEVGGDDYTIRFGGSRVNQSDILHVNHDNPRATFVGDLADGKILPSDGFDCMIMTQTLQFIFDFRAALASVYRTLKPGGVLLMTVPGTISQVESGAWTDIWYWGFSGLSIRKLCLELFPASLVDVQVHGNVLAANAFLQGIAAGELKPGELAFNDPLYPLLITVRAKKPASGEENR